MQLPLCKACTFMCLPHSHLLFPCHSKVLLMALLGCSCTCVFTLWAVMLSGILENLQVAPLRLLPSKSAQSFSILAHLQWQIVQLAPFEGCFHTCAGL